MTKHFGYEPGDFHFEDARRPTGFAARVLPRLFNFCVPLILGLIALYIGRYGFG